MAMAIRDESCMDRPIYLRVTCCGEENTDGWYVIEEKPLETESSEFSSSSSAGSSSSFSEEEDDNVYDGVVMECKSETDRIRRLSNIPDPPIRDNSLAVVNSNIYLIGGDIETATSKDKEYIGYRHLDLQGKRQWRLDGGRLVYDQYEAAAAVDGFIYSVGCHQYRLSHSEGIVEKLPAPPVEGLSQGFQYESRLLALTETKLFIYINWGVDYTNLMLSYDLGTCQWDNPDDVNYPDFSGHWSPGVVLDNRYLFSYGTQNPMSPALELWMPGQKVVPGIYVFDIQQRQWLPNPVENLQHDGTVLPSVSPSYFNTGTEMYVDSLPSCRPNILPYLFQIGKQNDRKLAVLWGCPRRDPKSGLYESILIWSKFIINKPAASDPIPRFNAGSLSSGFCAFDDCTASLLNCAVGM